MNINVYTGYQSPRLAPGTGLQAGFPQILSNFMTMMWELLALMSPPQLVPQSLANPGFGGRPAGHASAPCRPNLGGLLGTSHTPSAPALTSSSGHSAVATARQFIGERSWDIKGRMPHFRRAGGLGRNCADFVSAALQSAGMLGKHEVNVGRLEKRLIKEGWVRIPNSQAGPGDVAITRSRSHVELCQGNGKTIGSNNDNKKKPKVQYVTERKLRRTMIIYRKVH